MADNVRIEGINALLSQHAGKAENAEAILNAAGRNTRAIERLVKLAHKAGVLDEYRPVTPAERKELNQSNPAGVNAYYVKLNGRGRYITYQPREGKGSKSGKLEHVNRSTEFIESLLTKISSEYSFLYCSSRITNRKEIGAPPLVAGVTFKKRDITRQDCSKKYELFFLVECLDNIEAAETLYNVIDSVLLDVKEGQSDLFQDMSYARLERDEGGDDLAPEIDGQTRDQLNAIIGEIRDEPGARRRILQFLADTEDSGLNAYFDKRDTHYRSANANVEKTAFNSTVVCRLMPIGVFLNEIENYLYTYTLQDIASGETVSYAVNVSPANPLDKHVCPHCGGVLGSAVLCIASGKGGALAVGCTACAKKCAADGCTSWTLGDDSCAVCAKPYCRKHTGYCTESGAAVCNACTKVFKDNESGGALAPGAAAVLGQKDSYVQNYCRDYGAQAALEHFAKTELYRKSACIPCRTREGGNVFYLTRDTGECAYCGERFFKGDLVREQGGGRVLCFDHGGACGGCGSVVCIDAAIKCGHPDCRSLFCNKCTPYKIEGLKTVRAAKLLGSSKKFSADGQVYCRAHLGICKTCGKVMPLEKLSPCLECGGKYCASCAAEGNRCAVCAASLNATAYDYKQRSSPTRLKRLNYLPLRYKLKRVGVFEDNADIVFVLYKRNGKRLIRVCRKLQTGKHAYQKVWRKLD